ncbi:hypothetical protein [Kitasatospora sp. NPDC097643]|uniref:hypothetical protein n=1 Tax=Kitasatospora sp. NPDC097643 TaxID=3157230 RepID=UPI0033313774
MPEARRPDPADTSAIAREERAKAQEAARRQAFTDPLVRFGEPDRTENLTTTFGPGWELATWDGPQAQDVQRLLHHGQPVGWTAPLPDGPWGTAGHIAAEHQEENTARVLTDDLGRPRTHRDPDEALDALLRSHNERERAPRLPTLTLGPTTSRTAPTNRGLGEADRDYALGDGLVHLTWPTAPNVQALERRGRLVGRTEVYDDNDSWIAPINGHSIADAADNLPLLSTNPTDALTLLRLAVARDLGSIPPGWVLPRTAG